MLSYFSHLLPSMAPVSRREALRASIGALVGILLTGLITRLALGDTGAVPLLIAPMGASAVLLFAAPTSPLAQPWSIIGGNLIASLVGVSCALWLTEPILAAGVALSIAIGLMFTLRCLHPPSGAVALTAVLGGPAVIESGYTFVLWPVGLNSVLLLAAALLFNNLTGRRYPHIPPRISVEEEASQAILRGQFLRTLPEDLNAVLRQYDEVVNISPDQLDLILSQAQLRAYQRKADALTCGDIMVPVYNTVTPQTRLRAAWTVLGRNGTNALPVLAENAELAGIVSQSDFISSRLVNLDGNISNIAVSGVGPFLSGSPLRRVEHIMTRNVQSALPETPIAKLVPAMAIQGLHQIPVVNAHNRVVGMVTQSALIGALFDGKRVQQHALETA